MAKKIIAPKGEQQTQVEGFSVPLRSQRGVADIGLRWESEWPKAKGLLVYVDTIVSQKTTKTAEGAEVQRTFVKFMVDGQAASASVERLAYFLEKSGKPYEIKDGVWMQGLQAEIAPKHLALIG